MDELYSVPDPSDWLSTSIPAFAAVEAPLHCQICKEFYDTPMITSCNHTFCSRCIRTSLSQDGKCPACRTADQASKLRNNWALQEVVAAFVGAREDALGVAKQAQEGPRVGKRKRAEEEVQTRTTRSKSRRIARSGSQHDSIEIEDSVADEEEYKPELTPPPRDGLVECPLDCGKRMKEEEVFAHLDKCETEKQERQRKSKVSQAHLNGFGTPSHPTTRPQDRINQLNYSMLKDSALAKKLKEGGIPSWGTKQLMTNRHREWVNIWNANCDSTQPRKKRELLHDLDVWERTQGGKAPTANSSLMRKDFDGDAHSKLHHDDFSRLIADARRKKNLPAPDETKAPEAEDAVMMGEQASAAPSQTEQVVAEVCLPLRAEEAARPETYVPPPSSQQPDLISQNEAFDIMDGRSSQPQRHPTRSQEFARQNHAFSPVTEQVIGR